MKSPRIPQSSFNDYRDNPRSWSSSSSQLNLTTWRLQNSYSCFNNKCFPIEQGEETSLFSDLGFEAFFLRRRRIQQTPITKVQEEFHNLFLMLLLVVVMMLMEHFTSSQLSLKPWKHWRLMAKLVFNLMLLMELFTFSQLNLKPWRWLKTHGWTHVQSDDAHGALNIFTAQSKTLREAEDLCLNSCFSDVMMHKIHWKFTKKSKPRWQEAWISCRLLFHEKQMLLPQ